MGNNRMDEFAIIRGGIFSKNYLIIDLERNRRFSAKIKGEWFGKEILIYENQKSDSPLFVIKSEDKGLWESIETRDFYMGIPHALSWQKFHLSAPL
jgi:hypothetical protein